MSGAFSRCLFPAVAAALILPSIGLAVPVAIAPDVSVSQSAGSGFVGVGVENTTGAGQTIRQKTKRRALRAYFNVKNNGGAYAYPARGTKGNNRFRASYRNMQNGANITAEVTAGAFAFDPIPMNGTAQIRLKVKPTKKLKRGSKRFCLTSSGETYSDTCCVRVKKRK